MQGPANAFVREADPPSVLEAALPIFLLTYGRISLQRFRGFQLSRPIASEFGAALMVVSAALLNLISSVPAVLLLAPVTTALGGERAWLVLASSSTLAGNATRLGAASNLITAEVARSHGLDFNWLRFTMIGLPVSLLTLAVSTVVVAFLPL